jgi:hypothetical protein
VFLGTEDEAAPVAGFRGLTPTQPVRLLWSYDMTWESAKYDGAGKLVELACTVDLDSSTTRPAKGQGTIHWVADCNAVDVTLNLYDNLFTVDEPLSDEHKDNWLDFLNPVSLVVGQVRGMRRPFAPARKTGAATFCKWLCTQCLHDNTSYARPTCSLRALDVLFARAPDVLFARALVSVHFVRRAKWKRAAWSTTGLRSRRASKNTSNSPAAATFASTLPPLRLARCSTARRRCASDWVTPEGGRPAHAHHSTCTSVIVTRSKISANAGSVTRGTCSTLAFAYDTVTCGQYSGHASFMPCVRAKCRRRRSIACEAILSAGMFLSGPSSKKSTTFAVPEGRIAHSRFASLCSVVVQNTVVWNSKSAASCVVPSYLVHRSNPFAAAHACRFRRVAASYCTAMYFLAGAMHVSVSTSVSVSVSTSVSTSVSDMNVAGVTLILLLFALTQTLHPHLACDVICPANHACMHVAKQRVYMVRTGVCSCCAEAV